jgi:ABC-type xylose transport system permease subunit
MTEARPEHPVIAAWHRRPLSSRVGSRRFRRRLVIATYAGWLVWAGSVKFLSYGPLSPIQLSLLLVAGNVIIQAMWVDRRTIINTPALVDAELDERLIQSRNAAFRKAFKIFALAVLIAWPVSVTAIQLQPNNQGYLNALILFIGVAMLATTLPTAIVAWREPDPAEPEPPQI